MIKKTDRDRQRLEEHRQNRAVTRSQAAMKDSNVKQNAIENFRSDDCSPDNGATCVSPVQVLSQSESIISPNVSHSMPLPCTPDYPSFKDDDDMFDDIMTMSPFEPNTCVRPIMSRPVPQTSNIVRGPCHRLCSWSSRFKDMEFDKNMAIYRCMKCPQPPNAVITNVCKPCLTKGVHAEHFDHLRMWQSEDVDLNYLRKWRHEDADIFLSYKTSF